MPQPRRQTVPRSARASIYAHEISETTVYSAKVEQPMKWWSGVPSCASLKRRCRRASRLALRAADLGAQVRLRAHAEDAVFAALRRVAR